MNCLCPQLSFYGSPDESSSAIVATHPACSAVRGQECSCT